MRKLQATDLFGFCRLVNEIGFKEEIKQYAKEDRGTDAWDAGYEIIYTLFEKAVSKKAEQEVFKFIGGIFEIDADEVARMDPVELLDNLMQVASVEKWKDFFSRAANLMK